jgi:signal transduction histidine kinase/ligand-binding sensor domain-containing protein
MRAFLSLSVLLIAYQVSAQQYRFHEYRVEQGLPSDVIKAVTEDSLGFIWIASDDGLVKYDGVKFTTYKNGMRSQFAKGFIKSGDGRLFAFSDLDFVEIINRIDTVEFKTIVRGERFLTDSTLSYPKSVYQDRQKLIWMGEPKSVISFDGDKIKRYDFTEVYRSPVFVRSFSFFEDDQNQLYTIAYNGAVFRLDRTKDKFVLIKGIELPDEISHVLFFDHQLFIAARKGLFRAAVVKGDIQQPENLFPVVAASHLTIAADSSLIVSTYGEDLYRVSFRKGFKWENFYYHFNGINSSYISSEGDIWVATDKGMVVVQQNSFALADPNSQAHFIEGITDDENGNVYFATKETLIQLERKDNEWQRRELMNDKTNYFQSLQFTNSGLWAATNWNVILIQNGRVTKKFDFSDEGNFVHHVFLDSRGNVWLSQAGNPRIRCITPTLHVRAFRVEGINQSEINHIEEGPDGMYAAANGSSTYMFFMARKDSVFRNISIPVTFEVRGDFSVLNIAIQGNDFWLATTEGLLKFDRQNLVRQNKGQDFERFPVSCVKVLNREEILFSNSFGLFRFNTNTGEYWLYDEDSGLPSNTITEHGIHISRDSSVWVGTSYGLATALRNFSQQRLTRTPYCVEARINGVPRRYANGLKANFGAYITLQFSPVSFPEKKIDYQWKLNNESDWRALDKGLLSLSDMKEGKHVIFVRAKKNTGLSWSSPGSFPIVIDPPYWKQAEFIFLVFLVVILIAWASYAISSAILNQRRQYLEGQINERTQELKKANEELTIRNTELDRFVYSASHDLSAPLKSILGLIRVAKLDKPDDVQRQYLDMMERSVFKLEDFIEEVVTYSRNTRMPLKFESLDFRQFVLNLLQDHEYSPNFGQIDFQIEDHIQENMISDVTRMKIILNNLISNAIKFHWIDNGRKPMVKIGLDRHENQYIVTVKDNGKGIPQEHLKRIFEMFYRATDEAQGSGLGLYILKEAVLKLGGTVEAHSALEVGTEFVIRLPVPILAPIVGNDA